MERIIVIVTSGLTFLKEKDKFWESQGWEVGKQPCGAWFLSWLSSARTQVARLTESSAKEGSHWKQDNVFPDPLVCTSVVTVTIFCKFLTQSGWAINTQNLVASSYQNLKFFYCKFSSNWTPRSQASYVPQSYQKWEHQSLKVTLRSVSSKCLVRCMVPSRTQELFLSFQSLIRMLPESRDPALFL